MTSPFSFPPPLEQTPISFTPSSPPYDSTTEAGTGGKLRTRRPSLMRKKTPYDRPTSGRHAANGGASLLRLASLPDGLGSNIASRLVGSASRVLTSSASYLFSSIFKRKQPLLAVDGDAVAGGKPEDDLAEGSPSTQAEGIDVDPIQGFATEGNTEKKEKHGAELMEIEEIVKYKTLSREEFSRLTEILRSRIVDDGLDGELLLKGKEDMGKEKSPNGTQPIDTPQSEAQRWREERKKAREEKESVLWDLSLRSNALTPHLKISDGVSSSPVEVARAFMGDRSGRFTGPAMPFRSRIHQEQSPVKTLDLWQQAEGVLDNRYRTPAGKTWGRAPGALGVGTPYSRPQPPSVERAVPQRWTPAPVPLAGGREILKRRSSVLDDSWPTVGPIRRTRLKTLATAASNNFANTRGLGSSGGSLPYSAAILSGLNTHTLGKLGVGGNNGACSSQPNDDKKAVIPSLASVPVQSSETARRILETLEKMTPSPKGKSLDEELALVRESHPTELTPVMLNEHARKSMLLIDFPEFRESGPSSSNFGGVSPTGGIAANATGTAEHIKIKGKEKVLSPRSSLASKEKDFVRDFESLPSKADGSTGELRSTSKLGATLQVSKADASLGESRSISKLGMPDGSAFGSDKKIGFRMSAVFEESNSDDDVRICMTANPTTVSTAAQPVFGGKSFLSQPESPGAVNDAFYASSPESTMKTTVSSFTFPLNSPPGVLFEPPTPKPMFSPSSSAVAINNTSLFPPPAVSSDGKGPQYQFGAASADGKEAVFSFTGSMTSEQAASKPAFLFKHESRPELAFSNAAVAAAASLSQFSSSGQVLPEPEIKSSTDLKATTFPGISSFSTSPVFSTISSIVAGNQLPQFSIAGTSSKTESGSANAVLSSSLFGASNTAFAFSPSLSGFGKQNVPLQFGSTGQGISVPTSAEVESDKPQKRYFAGADQDASKSSIQVSVAANGSTDRVLSRSGVVATPVAASMMPTGMAPTSFSFVSSSASESTPLFGCSSATTFPSPSPSPSIFGGISTCAAAGIPVSSSSPSLPFAFGGSPSSSSFAIFGNSTAGTTGLSSSTAGASIQSFGAANSSSFGAGNSSVFGLASTPTFGVATTTAFGATNTASYGSTPTSSFGTTSSLAFGTSSTLTSGLPSGPTFGSTSTLEFSSGSLFGASTAKPFGLFAGDSTSQSTTLSTPLFGSGFGTTSTGFFSSTPSSSGFGFGGSLASASAGSAFSPSSGVSLSPFQSVAKGSPTGAHQPMFGSSSFGSSVPVGASGDISPNDQMNMEDSMAEEPSDVGENAAAQPSIFAATSGPAPTGLAFGGQATSATGQSGFAFGSQATVTAAGQSLFTFSAQSAPSPFTPPGASVQNPFAQPVNLDYGGGGFTPGATGGEKSGRRFIKARRTVGKKGK